MVLGLRTLDQERQLDSKRLVEEQQLLTEQTGHSLLSELEKIKLEEVTKAISDKGTTDAVGWKGLVAFVGPIVDGQLRLPWENSSKARKFQELLNEENFASKIREGEKQEVAAHQYENAVRQYRAALDAAEQPAQQSYAHLLLARALQKSGRVQESHGIRTRHYVASRSSG